MATIRRMCRAFLLVGWLTVIALLVTISCIGKSWKVRRRVAKCSLLWGKGLAWIFGIKTKIIGDPQKVSGGLVVSNHTGYVDIMVHAGVWPIRFAAKSSIKYWPFIGWFVSIGRPIWIDRKSVSKSKIAEKEFRDTMTNDIMLLVYPEGTSTSGKDGILEFKSTPFEAAAQGDNWIIPAIIRYGDTPDGKPIAWYDDMTFLPHLWRIFGYKRIYAEITVMEPFKPEGRDRKELSAFTHEQMRKEYEKIFADSNVTT